MNIFEELAESYTYNGVVSLKALDDDIVTLENQIDSYNATLRELQLRGKKVGPLVGKIRDAKIRLSLLKAVYKRESDKATPDDVILNMLGVSAKNAKEVDAVNTAADGREPKPQNFESAELEGFVEGQAGVEVKPAENEKVVDNEAIVTEEDETDIQTGLIEDKDSDDEIVVVDKNASEEELKELYTSLASEDEVIVVRPEILTKIKQEKDMGITGISVQTEPELSEGKGETLNIESICKDVELTTVPAPQIPAETDMKNVEAEKASKEEETRPLKPERKTLTNTVKKIIGKGKLAELSDTVPPKASDDYVKSNDIKTLTECEHETIENAETIPPPNANDYCEPELGPSCEEVTYGEDSPVYSYLNETPPEILGVTSNDPMEYPDETIVPKEDLTEVDCVDSKVYNTFYSPDNKIYVSFDLCGYTDMVNTNSITGIFNDKHKTLELTFTDIRDYSHLLFFLGEKNKKHSLFDRFVKNQRSIIMYVRTEIDGIEKEYRYEFTGCRLVDVFDSEYKSMKDSTYCPTSTHEFYAKFKYKRLKIN